MGSISVRPAVHVLRIVLLAAFVAAAAFPATPGELKGSVDRDSQKQPVAVADLLKPCAAYCERLSDAVLDFVCLERVNETVAELVIRRPLKNLNLAGWEDPGDYEGIAKNTDPATQAPEHVRARRKISSEFIYDYQLVQDRHGDLKETRNLIRENGRPVMEKGASLKTQTFNYTYLIMGPATLLGGERQNLFDYTVVKETTLGKDRAIIINATPKPRSSSGVLSGKVWIRKSDAAVLRIEWVPESIGNYERIMEVAKRIKAQPRLIMSTDFAFEKNGIRFPSRYTIWETYVPPAGAPLVRSTTEVTLSDYKYFTVQTSAEIR